MKQQTTFKVYRNNKLDLRDAVTREVRFRAGLFKETGLEIGKIVLSNFNPIQ